MIEVREHDIISAGCQGSIEDNRSNFLGVGMGEAVRTLCPAIGKSWEAEDWATLSYPSGIGPDTLNLGWNKRRLFGEFKAYTHDVLDVLGSEVQIVLGFVQLGSEFLQLTPQIALEFEHLPCRLSLLLSASGV